MSMHNELGYCRSRTTPDGSGQCICDSTQATTRPRKEPADRMTDCCGHVFQTAAQRRSHERRVERGEQVQCPCGDTCSAGVAT